MDDSLIQSCENCDVRMDVTEIEPFRRVQCVECGTEQRVKRDFGHYYLQRRHALGGMSVVFLAEDKNLGREVALKVLNEEYSSQEKRIAAFEKEAEVTASVTHPHIVKVYTVGHAWGHFYLAMEMIQGKSMEELMKNGPMLEEELLPLMLQVVDGLRAAYQAELIHRDMKPGNILVVDDGSAKKQAKIVDFGLALMTHAGEAQADEVWATPFYVSPETLEGKVENFRSDIYALGATMYHALYGKPPFEVDSTATNVLRLSKNQIKPLGEVAPWVSDPTSDVIDRMMKVNADERHGSYDELEADLLWARKSLSEEGLSRPETVLSRQRAERRQNQRRIQWGIGGGILAIVALVLVSIFSKPRSEKSITQAMDRDVSVKSHEDEEKGAKEAKANQFAAARINKKYREARKALERGDYKAAKDSFEGMAAEPRAKDPTVSWAKFESAMMSYFMGNANAGEKHLRELHLSYDALPEEKKRLAPEQLIHSSRALLGGKVISFRDLEIKGGDSSAVMEPFIYGLLHWELGKRKLAREWFQSFMALPRSSDWIEGYQKVAGDYLADYELVEKSLLQETPKGAKAITKLSEELEDALSSLRSRGRLPDQVRGRLADLVILHEIAVSENKAEQVEVERLEAEAFEGLLVEAVLLAKAYEFDRAKTVLERLDEENALHRNQKDAIQMIVEGASSFIENLAENMDTGFVAQTIRSRAGDFSTQFVKRVSEDGLELSGGGEERFLSWAEIEANSLIGLHIQLEQKEREEERLQLRRWLICFSWLEGENAKADEAAAKLAEKNPSFGEDWALLKHLKEWRH